MKNPWNSKPVLICATPIIAVLSEVIILGYSMGFSDSARQKKIYDLVSVAVLFFPLVSIPALWAAVGGLKTNTLRYWYVAGALLNSAYCLLLSIPMLAIATIIINSAKK